MKYQKAKIENGSVVITYSKEINQNELTADCWAIQFQGLVACKNCGLKDTADCGEGETLKRMKGE